MSASNQKGFTLLEILIAITLLAFISLGVVSVTENSILTMERTTQINKNNLQIEAALSRFEWDFSQIYSPLYFSTVMNINPMANQYPGGTPSEIAGGTEATKPGTTPQGMSPELQNYYEQLVSRFERNQHFSGLSKDGMPIPRFYAPERDVFEFFTASNRRKTENTKQSHFAWVRYSLIPQEFKSDSDTPVNPNVPKSLKSLVRYFSADDPYADERLNIENVEKVKGAVLLENVERMEFSFWDPGRKKWETSLRTIQGGEGLIRGVKLNISWYDYSGNIRTAERIFRNHWPMFAPMDPNPRAGINTTTPANPNNPLTPQNPLGQPGRN